MHVSYTLGQLKEFARAGYARAPLYGVLFADLATPIRVLAAIKRSYGDCFLFESVEGGEKLARYSFIGFDPSAEIFLSDGEMTVRRGGLVQKKLTRDPNAEIRSVLGAAPLPQGGELPPFTGGLVGYFSYEYYKYYNSADFLPAGEFGDARLMLFDKVVVFDNFNQKIYAVVNLPLSGVDEKSYAAACGWLEDMRGLIVGGGSSEFGGAEMCGQFKITFSKESYEKKVEQAKSYVREGEIFQCVPSNIWRAEMRGSLINAYRVLRTTNPSPYMIYMSMGDVEIAGASPETLVRLSHGKVSTFPIAGSRPRGADDDEDRELERGLLADEKEVAEHNMLVDLGRNDIGKICKFGTVRVEEYKKVYRFSHVMHITSAVAGEAREGIDALDALAATLPAGTLSGAPKRRAMQIINELEEGAARGIYGGAVGYINFAGDGDFCIAIRTAAKRGDSVTVRAGGGIVADSVPENEFYETVNKSAAVREAIIKSCGVEE